MWLERFDRLYTWSGNAMMLCGPALGITFLINSDSQLIPWIFVGFAISSIVMVVSGNIAGVSGGNPGGSLGIAFVAAATTLLVSAHAYAIHDVQPSRYGHSTPPAETASVSGDPHPILILFAVIGVVAVMVHLIGAASSSSAGRSSTPHDHGMPPPPWLVLVLAVAGALFGTVRPAHAIVDCMSIEHTCKNGTVCGWDTEKHIHRCLPVAQMPKEPTVPTHVPVPAVQSAVRSSVAVSPSDDCATPWTTVECPSDRPNEHRACVRTVRAHNERCARLRTCKDARERASQVCRTATEKGRVESVASSTWERICNAATLDAKKACTTIP